MGYGFMVWAVDTAKLQQVCGSKDDKLRRMIGGRFKRKLASLDELFSSSIARGQPNTYEVLRQIIDGTVPEGARGGLYFYAFGLLVEHFGRALDNAAVYPWGSADMNPTSEALRAMGVPFALDAFQGCSLPVKLPYPDDFPSTGWLPAGEVARIDRAFAESKPVPMDAGTAEVVSCIRGWFREASALGRGLVSYYH
jgi:hypothetical protein